MIIYEFIRHNNTSEILRNLILDSNKKKKLAFYVDYERFNSKEAPPILFFISFLRNAGYEVDFFIREKDLLDALNRRNNIIRKRAETKRELAASSEAIYAQAYYDACLLSLMSADSLRKILQTAIKVKEISPYTANILGGTGVYGYFGDLIIAEGIDVTIEGDAEKTLPAVLDNIVTFNRYCAENYNKNYKDSGLNAEKLNDKIFKRYPKKLKSGITKQEAYFCGQEHMELLFKSKGWHLSPIITVPDMIYFQRKISGYTVNCPISNVAIKLNNGVIRLFEKVDAKHNNFNKFYGPYKEIILSEKEFENFILPFPTEEEINAGYTGYPWDIYEQYGFESIGVYAQRGCNWGKCSYCSIVNYKYRKLDIGFLIKILTEAKKRRVSGFSFDDDLFVQNKLWTNDFLDKIIAGKFNNIFDFTAMVKVEHIDDINLLNKLKQANFTKIQIGVESFLPKKISYFSKTKEEKELIYVNKAKNIINYCASIGIIPSSFIILTSPNKDFNLSDIVQEVGEIIDIIIEVYNRYKSLPIFMFNDFINAYPGAPLLAGQSYSKFMVPLCGEAAETNEDGGDYTATMNLRSVCVPYLYKFENMKIAHFIGILLKNSANGSRGFDAGSEGNKNNAKNIDMKKSNIAKTEEERMFIHIKNILNSLNYAFDLYGTPAFLLYDIVDRLDLIYNESPGVLQKILANCFNVSDINKFKNYIASNKIDANAALDIFRGIISGYDEICKFQQEEKDKGKAMADILLKRIEGFYKNYNF